MFYIMLVKLLSSEIQQLSLWPVLDENGCVCYCVRIVCLKNYFIYFIKIKIKMLYKQNAIINKFKLSINKH